MDVLLEKILVTKRHFPLMSAGCNIYISIHTIYIYTCMYVQSIHCRIYLSFEKPRYPTEKKKGLLSALFSCFPSSRISIDELAEKTAGKTNAQLQS